MVALMLADMWIGLWLLSLAFVAKLAYDAGRNHARAKGRTIDHSAPPRPFDQTTHTHSPRGHHWR